MVFNLTTGECSMKDMELEEVFEFPIIEQSLMGYKNRFTYMPYSSDYFKKPLPASQGERDNMWLRGFAKFDLKTEKILKKISFGPTHTGGEVIFQRKESASKTIDETNEDEGYLMSAVHNWETDKSELVVWDAQTLNVVLRAGLKDRVPNGFHGAFVHENDL
mmetsp:Transcript_12485/g.20990  ORF Transcript_12485/g.20990 Transcript_12485/m.20990 type:complete len:162 (+) Transcript_12485:1330-1815(+)